LVLVVTLSVMDPGAAFSATMSGDGARMTIAATGEVDLLAAPELRAALVDATQSGANEVALDLSGVSFIDSTGLSVIVHAWRRLDADGRRLVVTAASEPVTRVVTTAGLAGLLGLDA
jgi:anti-sigma B factor antagonist